MPASQQLVAIRSPLIHQGMSSRNEREPKALAPGTNLIFRNLGQGKWLRGAPPERPTVARKGATCQVARQCLFLVVRPEGANHQ
jgi:hypothetical protein